MNNINRCYTSYLRTVFEPALLNCAVKNIVKILKPLSKSYDAIVFRGMSGSLIAPIIAMRLKKKLIMIRKGNDGNHSCMKSEGWKMVDRVVIIDDLVSSGSTIDSAFHDLVDARRSRVKDCPVPKVVAIVLYHDCNSYESGLPDSCLNDFTREHLSKVPIYSFMYEKEWQDELQKNTKTKFYTNKLVRKSLGMSEPEDGTPWIYVDVKC